MNYIVPVVLLAREAEIAPKTARRYLRGECVRPVSRRRIERALAQLTREISTDSNHITSTMNNTQLSELAVELLRIHLVKHDVPPEIEPLRAAAREGLVTFPGVQPVLTDAGIDAVNRMIVGLSERMVAQ